MSNLPFWVGALKISPEEYQRWLSELPAPDFVLPWAIETGKIDEAAYIRWAMAAYQMPLVSQEFLKGPAPVEMWKKYLQGPWTQTALPLFEWKDTLVVGVLEPKNFVLENVTIHYVMAPLSTQQPWWRTFAKLKQEHQIGNAPIVIPAAPTSGVTQAPVAGVAASPFPSPPPFAQKPPPPPTEPPKAEAKPAEGDDKQIPIPDAASMASTISALGGTGSLSIKKVS